MKLPRRMVFGPIWVAVVCTGQAVAGQAGAFPPYTYRTTLELAQNSPPAAKEEPGRRPIDATPAVPDPARAPAGEAGPATSPAKPGAPANPPVVANPYVIGPLDVLDVNVWNDPKLTHIYDVSPDGSISMPLIGVVMADGLTAPELAAAIKEKLLQVLNSPEVNVQVVRNNSKKFYIFGAVNHPGEFPLTGRTTVLDAFANSGGFRDFANVKKIRILRGAREYYFNYKDVSRGRHMEQNIVLENGDRIFVAE